MQYLYTVTVNRLKDPLTSFYIHTTLMRLKTTQNAKNKQSKSKIKAICTLSIVAAYAQLTMQGQTSQNPNELAITSKSILSNHYLLSNDTLKGRK